MKSVKWKVWTDKSCRVTNWICDHNQPLIWAPVLGLQLTTNSVIVLQCLTVYTWLVACFGKSTVVGALGFCCTCVSYLDQKWVISLDQVYLATAWSIQHHLRPLHLWWIAPKQATCKALHLLYSTTMSSLAEWATVFLVGKSSSFFFSRHSIKYACMLFFWWDLACGPGAQHIPLQVGFALLLLYMWNVYIPVVESHLRDSQCKGYQSIVQHSYWI